MTRQLRRHARRHPALAAAVVLVGLVLVLSIAAHLAGLVILAAAVGGGYLAGRRSRPAATARPARPAPRPAPSRPSPAAAPQWWQLAEADGTRHEPGRQLAAARAEITRLHAELADARASAAAAWDAAAERPPSAPAGHGPASHREALLAAPRSGVRSLVGGVV
jgi:hypothetical protein